MQRPTRRRFLRGSAIAAGLALTPEALRSVASASGFTSATLTATPAPDADAIRQPKPWQLGMIIGVGDDPEKAISTVDRLGLPTCQLEMATFTADLARRLRRALDHYDIVPTAIVTSGPGQDVYDFVHGPITCGLVPPSTRAARVARLKQASDFAKGIGIAAVQTHCGFIPANPNNPLYRQVVLAIREVASYCRKNGQMFRYETGQETPITMLRAIEDVGLDNQGINFDTANFVLYDTANPVDALDVVGAHVQGTHMKDGLLPTNPNQLGREVLIGQGMVNFAGVIQKLRKLDYRGALTIERETSGPQQLRDIESEKAYLEKLLAARG
jgi:L-ribulose-5-phosphate 3-epimerase